MKVTFRIILILTIILSLATGLFKILQQEDDIALFQAIGFNSMLTTLLGIIQFAGGVLLMLKKTRQIGAWIMIATFAIASLAVFANGMLVFGLVSLLFIAMAIFILFRHKGYEK